MKRAAGFVVAALLAAGAPAIAGVKVVQANGKWGIADPDSGELRVRPFYDAITRVADDFFIARKGDDVGAIDAAGATLIPFNYGKLSPVRGFGRTSGLLVAEKKFEQVTRDRRFLGNRNRVETTPSGRAKILRNEPVYQEVERVRREVAVGLIDRTGETVVPLRYDALNETIVDGVFLAGEGGRGGRRYGLLDAAGEVLLPIEYDAVQVVSVDSKRTVNAKVRKGFREEEVAIRLGSSAPGSGKPGKFRKDGLFGFRAADGREIAPPVYEDAWDFRNGFARVKRDGKWGFIAEDGRVAVEPRFDYAWDFDGGRAKVRLEDGGIRHIDSAGTLVDE